MSAVAEFFAEFGRAFSHLVLWAYLLAILTFLSQTAVRSLAWRSLSGWLGASVVDWQEVAANPAKPALVFVLILAAIVSAVMRFDGRRADSAIS